MTSTTGVKIPPPVHNSLKLKALDPASQAGRITFPGQTRGQKADRLQLVAKIAPIAESDAALHHWSATGVAVTGGNAYISWHSNHQASEIENVSIPADAWGGALDVVSIAALMAPQQGVSPISNTMTSLRVRKAPCAGCRVLPSRFSGARSWRCRQTPEVRNPREPPHIFPVSPCGLCRRL